MDRLIKIISKRFERLEGRMNQLTSICRNIKIVPTPCTLEIKGSYLVKSKLIHGSIARQLFSRVRENMIVLLMFCLREKKKGRTREFD